jgi:hypothetical protein
MKRSLALVLAVVAAGVVAASGAASATSRGAALHVTKECSEYDGTAGSFCTIVSSNIEAIKPGMRVVYLRALSSDGSLNSDILLTGGPDGVAIGHVVLDDTTSRVVFWGGTGRFAGFLASAVVSVDGTGVWHWDGTYSIFVRGWN